MHLDPFTSTQSSILVTNAMVIQAVLNEPNLTVTTNRYVGLPVYVLAGELGNYVIQASTNLLSWTNIAFVANTNGSVNFADPSPTAISHRYYRAMSE
jgi:hypothetical protein